MTYKLPDGVAISFGGKYGKFPSKGMIGKKEEGGRRKEKGKKEKRSVKRKRGKEEKRKRGKERTFCEVSGQGIVIGDFSQLERGISKHLNQRNNSLCGLRFQRSQKIRTMFQRS